MAKSAKASPALPATAASTLLLVAPTLDAATDAGIAGIHASYLASRKAGATYALDLRNFLVGLPHGNAQQITLAKQKVELVFADAPDMGAKIDRLIRQSVIVVCGTFEKGGKQINKGIGVVAFSETLGPDTAAGFRELSEAIRDKLSEVTGKEEKRGASTPTAKPAADKPAAPAAKEPTSSKALVGLLLRSLKMLDAYPELKLKASEKFTLEAAFDTLESIEARVA